MHTLNRRQLLQAAGASAAALVLAPLVGLAQDKMELGEKGRKERK